jgi:hypothetical protein
MSKKEKRADVVEAQHVLDVACNSDYFTRWASEKNVTSTHKALREAALDLLQDQFPNVDVKVKPYNGSEYVDLECIERTTPRAA